MVFPPMQETSSLDSSARRCAQLIKDASVIAALTGAGISTKAGIPDFRGPRGLYVTRQYDPEKVFDIDYFSKDPKPFFQFARDFIGLEGKLQPTVAHRFLARLEGIGKLKGIVTQNIDSLHHKAGSQKVYEMHGSFWQSFCRDCDQLFSYKDMCQKLTSEEVPRCSCGGVIKPDVVFFGENVKHLQESYDLANEADLFFVIGTSCVVYPAAMLPTLARGKIVVVNLDRIQVRLANVALEVRGDIDDFFTLLQAQFDG